MRGAVLAFVASLFGVACGGGAPGAASPEPETVTPSAPVTTTPVARANVPPPDDALAAVLDDRPQLSRPRSVALVVRELTAFEALFKATARAAADRPLLVMRLAEDYAELGVAATRDGRVDVATKARATAIRYYELLVAEHADFAQLAEARYHLALEYERGGDLDAARRVYLDLIQKHPSSRRAPYAYFAFGEELAADAKSDPSKWSVAQESYERALELALPDDALYGWVELRLGDAMAAQAQAMKASAAYRAAGEWANSHASLRGASKVAAKAAEALE